MSKLGTSITKRCKLLCPDGCGMKRAKEIDAASYGGNLLRDTKVILSCGHTRGEILPASGVSLELIYSSIGYRLFPIDSDAKSLDRWRLN